MTGVCFCFRWVYPGFFCWFSDLSGDVIRTSVNDSHAPWECMSVRMQEMGGSDSSRKRRKRGWSFSLE